MGREVNLGGRSGTAREDNPGGRPETGREVDPGGRSGMGRRVMPEGRSGVVRGVNTASDWLSGVMPDWLSEVMRPKKTPPPWATMVRAVLAIWVPLAVGLLTGHRVIALLPAMGGLMSIMIDNGGPFRSRVRRVGIAALFGGALGIAVGSLIHGRGWVAVGCIVALAAVSSVMARLGGIGSVTGLQLMIYGSVSLGPLGQLRPWWHTALEFIVGVAWALLLLVPGWLASPGAVEQRLIAAVYHRIADGLRVIGTPGTVEARRNVTAALNAAYDALLTGRRSAAGGRSRRTMYLMAVLNVSHQMTEAAGSLRHEGERPPPWVSDTVDRLAGAIQDSPPPFLADRHDMTGGLRWFVHPAGPASLPTIPPQWSPSPGALALRESMVTLARVISGNWTPPSPADGQRASLRSRIGDGVDAVGEQLLGGWVAWTFTIRLTLCTGIAAVISEVAPLTRSYWVVLTVAIILKPDFGSVFARALQRGIGTVIGAVLGAAILAMVPYGPWLLLPFGLLAALLPYGKSRNFGLSAAFLTPLVVLLIDLLNQADWALAADRALDTVLASVIVLVAGYAVWPVSWQAHLPAQFASTLRDVCSYLTESLVTGVSHGGSSHRRVLRRQAFRSLSDLRAEFQRTMSEPDRVSRRASAWWPALVGLEELLDAITTTSLAISRGAPRPAPRSVHQVSGMLRAVADAMDAGLSPTVGPLPADAELQPVTDAVRSVLAVLTPGPAELRVGAAGGGGNPLGMKGVRGFSGAGRRGSHGPRRRSG